jgi:hypothetical protein
MKRARGLRVQSLAALLIVVAAGVASWSIVQSAHNPVPNDSPKSLADCQVGTKTYRCYATYYANLAYDKGSKAAIAEMETAYNTDDYVKAECHQLTHVVGRTAFEKTGSLEKAYQSGDNFCWSGFYHGAIEQAISELGTEKIKENTATICKSFADKQMYSFDHFNCVHGLGHGLMAVAGYNLFDGLKYCDNTLTQWERDSCYGGVFMENVMVASRGDGTSAYLDASRPLYPCTDVDTKYKQQCYLMQTSYILQHNGYNFADAFSWCAKADADFVVTCYQSAGRDASGSTSSDITRTVANCNHALEVDIDHDAAMRNCMLGADRDFVSYYHDDQKALQLCDAFGEPYVAQCKTDVASYYSTF